MSGYVLDYAQRATRAVDAKGWFSLFARTRDQYGSLKTKERKKGREGCVPVVYQELDQAPLGRYA
jgi:hypothetical protein